MVNSALWPLVVVILLSAGLGIVNGFNDAANAIATVIGTRVLTPRNALILACVLALAVGGAFWFFSNDGDHAARMARGFQWLQDSSAHPDWAVQAGQRDRPATTLSPKGRRVMTTFRKLPTQAPQAKARNMKNGRHWA